MQETQRVSSRPEFFNARFVYWPLIDILRGGLCECGPRSGRGSFLSHSVLNTEIEQPLEERYGVTPYVS